MSEWTFSFDELVEVNFDAPGVPGRKGDPGEGLPAGGTTGQFARKASATDYDTEWVDVDATTVGADPAGTAADAYAAAVATAQGYTDNASAADRVYIDNEIAGLAPVASSGAYSDLTGRPTLGTAAAQNTTAFATAAQGAKADTAIQDDDLGTSAYLDVPATGNALTTQVVKGNDSRLSNARPPTAHTHTKSDISDFSDGDYATAAQGALADSASQPGHAHDISDLNTTGTPDGTKFLRDDGSWQVVSAGGGAVDSVNGETGVVVLDADDIDDSATVNKFATAAQLAAADSASQPGHTHTEADISDLGSYPDATGQPATKIAQTDGADGWTFVDPPAGGGGASSLPWATASGSNTIDINVWTTLSTTGGSSGETAWVGADRITVPEDGLYMASAIIDHTGSGSGSHDTLIGISKNGSILALQRKQAAYNAPSSGVRMMYLSAGDYVQAHMYQSDQAGLTMNGSLSVVRIDAPLGGSGYAPDPSAQPDGKWLTTASGAYVFTDPPAGGSSGGTPAHVSLVKDGDQTITGDTLGKVTWTGTSSSAGGMWSVSNDTRVTAPVAGRYLVTGTLAVSNYDGELRVYVKVNDIDTKQIERGDLGSDPSIWFSWSTTLDLEAGDYFELEVGEYGGTGDVVIEGTDANDNYMDVTLLSGSGGATSIGPGDWTAAILQNSWTNIGTPYNNAEYRLDSFGNVHLRGVITGGTTTSGTLLFTLPEGYRPAARIQLPVLSASTGTDIGRVDVYTDGTVKTLAVPSNVYLSLDGASFLSADAAPITVGGSGTSVSGYAEMNRSSAVSNQAAGTTPTQILFTDVASERDGISASTATSSFTVSEPGAYVITARAVFAAAETAYLRVYVNDSPGAQIVKIVNDFNVEGSFLVDVQSGDEITIKTWTTTSGNITTSTFANVAGPLGGGSSVSTPSISIPTFTATHAAGIGTLRWYNDTGSSITIAGARATLSADAVDAATVVDVNVDDVTALDAPISIAVGTRTTKVTDEIVVPADSYLTVDVDSVGTPGAGETLSVQFYT